MRTVARINVTPVRTFRLDQPERVELTADGAAGNRRFMLVDGDGNRLRSSLTTWGVLLRARYDPVEERLAVVLPDGSEVEESAFADGPELRPSVGDRQVDARVVRGAWEPALAELAGHPVRIVRLRRGADASAAGALATVVSDGSLARLEREAGRPVDARRFRMLFELAGCAEHEEDAWEGRRVAVGEAVLRVRGPVERCAFTTRDPETGERDLDALRLIAAYRGCRAADGAILFGRYADVERPGAVAVGDPVELL